MEVRLKQVDKNILRLVYGISVKSLHLHYFLADGKRCLERSGAMRVKSYRVESGATKKEQKKRASKIYLQSSLK